MIPANAELLFQTRIHQLTSCLVSCIAASIFGRVAPSCAATASRAGVTKDLKASNTPTLVRHLPFSRMVSNVLNTMRVDSGGKIFKMALTAVVAALRTTSPLSI